MQGQLLVLDIQESALNDLREWLWKREGRPPRALLKQMACGGFGCVLYCDLEANLKDEEIDAESLAQFAIASIGDSPFVLRRSKHENYFAINKNSEDKIIGNYAVTCL